MEVLVELEGMLLTLEVVELGLNSRCHYVVLVVGDLPNGISMLVMNINSGLLTLSIVVPVRKAFVFEELLCVESTEFLSEILVTMIVIGSVTQRLESTMGSTPLLV